MKNSRWIRVLSGLVPMLWSLGLSITLTWPMAARPAAAALGSQSGDGMKHLWTLWWMRSSVWDGGVFPFHTLRVNFPVGMDLYPIEPLNGLVAVALPWLDVVPLSNLLVLMNLTLTGLAGYWLGKVLTGSRVAGLVSATLLQGSAVMAFFVHVGVGELTHLWWLPLGMGCLVRARKTGQWRWFGALSTALIGAMLSCFYLGFFLALAVLVWAVCSLIPLVLGAMKMVAIDVWKTFCLFTHASRARLSRLREKARANSLFSGVAALYMLLWIPTGVLLSAVQWSTRVGYERRTLPKLFIQYTLAAALAVGIVWPVTQQFAASYNPNENTKQVSLQQYVFEDHGQPVTDPEHERLEIGQLVSQNREVSTRKESAYGGGRYLGWMTLLLCGIGLVRRPREAWPWVLVAGTGVLFAMGTYYTVEGVVYTMDGIPAESGGQKVQLPLLWLNRVLGYLAEPLNFPVRFLALASVAVAAMGALAAGSMRWPERWLARVPSIPCPELRGVSIPSWSLGILGLSMMAVVDVARGQQLDWPWASFTPRSATELEVLRDEPDLAVVDLGLAIRSDEENRWSALATQIAHGKAMNAVPVERIEYFARDGAFFVQSLQLVQDLSPLYQDGEGKMPGECSDGIDNDGNSMVDCADEPICKRYTQCGGQVEDVASSFAQYRDQGFYRGDLTLLRDAGFGWIVVSYRSGSENLPSLLQSTMDQIMGPASVRSTGLSAWAIPALDYTVEELQSWTQEHEEKIVILEKMTPGMGPQRPEGGPSTPSTPSHSAPPGAPPPHRVAPSFTP